jgi:hypothetical protein
VSVCVISQPRFFPGLHYLHRMMVADVFVVFDTVQFTPRHEENRAKLKTPNGSAWLTVPMKRTHREQRIVDTRIDATQNWRSQALHLLERLYGKAPRYETYAAEVHGSVQTSCETLTQLTRASWEPALRRLGIECRFVYASELPVSGKGPQLLLDICRHVGATAYLSGAFGREYLDVEVFRAAGIDLRFHEYVYPVYPQCHGEFVPFLSYLDMLFNVGLERETVLAGGQTVRPN